VKITWLTAVVDLPAPGIDAATQFWAMVTGSTPTDGRGENGEFITLIPPAGDPYLRLQQTAAGAASVHLDMYVPDIAAARSRALALGASLVDAGEWSVMRSPAGFIFCLVDDEGEREVPAALPEPSPHRLDQLSIDVPFSLFDSECSFWEELFGWERESGSLKKYTAFARPKGIPLRIILQRLGKTDNSTSARAHFDIACGTGREVIAKMHHAFGAQHVRTETYWITMTDPTGNHYCLTARTPPAPSLRDA
jgi:predicted enzyme related to lactoylglutathione lyase